ncbi:MAG: hypothetical protein RLZZ127_105 [Planctomycetota bacterium]|jgi:hypothetical protein
MSDPAPTAWRWDPHDAGAIRWPVAGGAPLPHGDHIEQGGRRAGQVVWYRVLADRTLDLRRRVVWPGLRVPPNNTHSSLMVRFDDAGSGLRIRVDGVSLPALVVDEVVIDGVLAVAGRAGPLALRRATAPDPDHPWVVEVWTLVNDGPQPRRIEVEPQAHLQEVRGPYGINQVRVGHDAPALSELAPGGTLTITRRFSAQLLTTALPAPRDSLAARREAVAATDARLVLETPEPDLDRFFRFAKRRVAEAIVDTRGGPMLAPGGMSYYAASWCNDNAEYAGPFFPFLGDAQGIAASLNTYRHYRPFMGASYCRIPSSIIAEGTAIWEGAGDRGDAAMYAYGCTRFCLALGDRAVAEELWPAIAWCLEYCRRKLTADGVPASDCDELERRLPAGDANLSTASLHYGGLTAATDLARALGRDGEAAACAAAAAELRRAIVRHFAAEVDGFATWRYFAGCTVLRSWICLPLCMGIPDRRDGTIAALLSPRLWTADGLATQAGERTFWDRSTLYGLRGIIQAGAVEAALPRLLAYARRRLRGEHVPYPVEAWPEGDQRHLSAESALLCRVATEGLFGILPTGLDRFRCTPALPAGWNAMALRRVHAFGRVWDLEIRRTGAGIEAVLRVDGRPPSAHPLPAGGAIDLVLSA